MSEDVRERIQSIVAAHSVVLFMKGHRGAPRCGFSASTVEILDRYLPEYHTVDVLADEAIRGTIKEVSNWPTIPQLYIKQEFVGGADIVREMEGNGELLEVLGELAQLPEPPKVTISEGAAAAIKQALGDVEEGDVLRLEIDGHYHNDLSIGPRRPGDLVSESNGIVMVFDPASARRADGLEIDFVQSGGEAGFRIANPNAPPMVQQMSVEELDSKMKAGDDFELIDVRTEEERKIAVIEGSRFFDEAALAELDDLPKDTPLVFQCHHGGRSQRAAEMFVARGFTEVYNLIGGIDAWSDRIDPSVPKY